VIAELERELGTVTVLTQNVDGFHHLAGSRNVIDIHGNLHDIICTRCRRKRHVTSYAELAPLPRCSSCGGIERPDVVLFGESLPEEKLDWLMRELGHGFDMVVSMGTSGTFPYIRLPMIRAQFLGWSSVDINPLSNPMTAYAEHHLPLRAADACEALWERVRRHRQGSLRSPD
jgi:NAD-dependent deacetylase